MQTLEQIVQATLNASCILGMDVYIETRDNGCMSNETLDKLQQLHQDVILQIEQFIKENNNVAI